MGRYFKVTEIPFEEFERLVGCDLGTYSSLGKTIGNHYYVGVDDEIEDEIVIPLEDVPSLAAEIVGESMNNHESWNCMSGCKNFGAYCDSCKEIHGSKYIHDQYNIADGTCRSCVNKYQKVDDEPCRYCANIMTSKFKEES